MYILAEVIGVISEIFIIYILSRVFVRKRNTLR